MSTETQVQVINRPRKSSAFWNAFTAVTAVSAVAVLAVFGDQIFDDSAHAVATGTNLTVAAPAVSLVCPQAIAAKDTGSVTIDGLTGAAAAGWSRTTAALAGGGGSVSFASLLPARDTSETPTAQDPEALNLPALTAPAGSGDYTQPATVSRSDSPQGALTVTTNARAVADATAGQFSAAGAASAQSGGDLRGVAASSCGAPASELWLVGGSTAVGSSAKLVIQNPSVTPATVKITLWGSSGRIEMAGSDTFLVAGGAQISTLLEGIAAEQRRIAIEVEATGAQVTAYIESSELDGVTQKGVDYVVPTAAPSRVQVMSGVVVSDADVDSPAASSVRVLVPDFAESVALADQSEEAAADVTEESVGKARLYLFGPQGNVVVFGADQLELVSGVVQDVSLGGVPAGTYTVLLESDVPVVAGARSVRTGVASAAEQLRGAPSDFAWVSAAPVYSNSDFALRSDFERLDLGSGQISDELVASSSTGSVAIPSGLKATVSIAGLPAVDTIGALDAALDEVPLVYAGDAASTAPDEDSADETDAKREAWKEQPSATLYVYRADGSVAAQPNVNLAVGQSKTIDLSSFGDVASVAVVAADEAVVDWAVTVEDTQISGSAARLAPVGVTQEPTDMLVSRTQQITK